MTASQTLNPDATAFEPLQLRQAFAEFPQGVVAIAAEVQPGHPEALVASTFTVGVSLEPPLVSFAVQHTSSTWPKIREGATSLGISVLGSEQNGLCRQIASKDRARRFDGVGFTTDDGAVRIEGSPLWLKARIHSQFPAGDHDIVVLEVLDLETQADQVPGLVFHRSQFKSI